MNYTVYLHRGIKYQTELNPGDRLRRVEYRDKYRTTHIWVKDEQNKVKMTIKLKKILEDGVTPFRTEDSGAGYNLTSIGVTTEVNKRGQVVIVYHTGMVIEIPDEYEATVRPVRSIAGKTLRMCDSPSVLVNNSEIVGRFIVTTDVIPDVYEKGEIFAQLVINKKESVDFEEIVDIKNEESSAAEGSQSLPENEDESINSETKAASGGEENVPEEA